MGDDREPRPDRLHAAGPYETGLRRLSRLAVFLGLTFAALFSFLTLFALYRENAAALPAVLTMLLPALLLYCAALGALTLSGALSLLGTAGLALCLLWSFGVLTLSRIALTAPVMVAVLAVNAANALLIGQLLYAVLADACRDMDIDAAVAKNLQRWTVPGAIAVAAMLIPILALAPLEDGWVMFALIAALGTVLASTPVIFVVLPYFLDRVPLAETIVARANSWRERREVYLLPLAAIASPRWAYAICGIVAVLSAVLLFEGGSIAGSVIVQLWREGGFPFAASIMAAAVMGALALRDWRAALVCALVPFVFASWGAYLIVQAELAPLSAGAKLLVLGGGFGAAIEILLLDAVGVYRRFDDDVQTALARAYYDSGPVIALVGIALGLAAALIALRFPEAAGAGAMILVQTMGVTLVGPSFAALLEDIFWKRKSAEELYRGH